jgi:hypothetical protein
MADLKAGASAILLFLILLLAAKQPLLISAALAGGAYLGVRLLLAPKTVPAEKPWLEPLAARWAGRDEGERLLQIATLAQRLRKEPELAVAVAEHLAYVKRACLPYQDGTNPSGQARAELITLLELVESRLLRLAEAHRHDDDRALASELAALRQTLIELVPERVLENRKQGKNFSD